MKLQINNFTIDKAQTTNNKIWRPVRGERLRQATVVGLSRCSSCERQRRGRRPATTSRATGGEGEQATVEIWCGVKWAAQHERRKIKCRHDGHGDATSTVVSTGDFSKDFFVTWSPSHVDTSGDGTTRSLKLDKDQALDLPQTTCSYLVRLTCKSSSYQVTRQARSSPFTSRRISLNGDEIDFELIDNVSGQPYILQTNVFADGFDNREERIYLWFDPTAEFHTYSILWNIHQIVFMVDWVPIRTYRNHADKGVAFPRWQPMSIKISLWNRDSWATRGGKDKVDWSKGPFIASFRNYKIDACVWKGNPRFCRSNSSTNWWNQEKSSSLTWSQRRLFNWVRKDHLIYDYCQDNKRFQNNLPKECSLPKY